MKKYVYVFIILIIGMISAFVSSNGAPLSLDVEQFREI
jgi:hypothetical protein